MTITRILQRIYYLVIPIMLLSCAKLNPLGSVSSVSTNFHPGLATAPTLSSVTPSMGSAHGGTLLTVTGTGFVSGATINVGQSSCTNVSVASATSATCITPAGSSGATVSITLTNPDGQTATLSNAYHYSSAASNFAVSSGGQRSTSGNLQVIAVAGTVGKPAIQTGGTLQVYVGPTKKLSGQ